MITKATLFRTIRLIMTGLFAGLLAGYVATYVTLRNRGLREMKVYDSEGFLYDSTERVFRTHDMSVHEFRYLLFAPANYVDRKFFDGPHATSCILFDLS